MDAKFHSPSVIVVPRVIHVFSDSQLEAFCAGFLTTGETGRIECDNQQQVDS